MTRFIGLAILIYLIYKYGGYLLKKFQSGSKPGKDPGKKGEYIDFEEVK